MKEVIDNTQATRNPLHVNVFLVSFLSVYLCIDKEKNR